MLELKEKIGTLEKSDVKIATIMALAMGTFFIYIGRLPLAVTFIPGLVITLTLIYFMYVSSLNFLLPSRLFHCFLLRLRGSSFISMKNL